MGLSARISRGQAAFTEDRPEYAAAATVPRDEGRNDVFSGGVSGASIKRWAITITGHAHASRRSLAPDAASRWQPCASIQQAPLLERTSVPAALSCGAGRSR